MKKLKYIKLFESATANGEHEIDAIYMACMLDLTEYVRLYSIAGLLNFETCARTFWNMSGVRVYNLKHCHLAESNEIGGYDLSFSNLLSFANMRKYVMFLHEKYGLKFVYSPQWDCLFVGIDGSYVDMTERSKSPVWVYIKSIVGPIQFNDDTDQLPDFEPVNEIDQR